MARILLLGESAGSSRYLLGALAEGGHEVHHIEARERLATLDEAFDVVCISDYPSEHLAAPAAERLVEAVRAGAGLVMIGGWSSYTGANGHYGRSPLAAVLPVTCLPEDDRRNVASGLWLEAAVTAHPILARLNLAQPPVICGYNAVVARPEATLLLRGRAVTLTRAEDGRLEPAAGEAVPLLVVGMAGAGRTVAYTSDLAPHWCGGIVDWGDQRRQLTTGAEVGVDFVRFVLNLVGWAAGDHA